MSNEQTPGAKEPNLPVLRNKDDVALWPTKAGDKALLSGHITLDGQKIQVRAFRNDTDRDGNTLAHPYLSLTTNAAPQGEPPQWKAVAYGNAVNTRKDDKPVYFDQIIFNVAGSDKTFSAYAGKGCTDEFHQQLGFTSAQVQRPEKQAAPEAADEDAPGGPSP
jgi:hypothetical protein